VSARARIVQSLPTARRTASHATSESAAEVVVTVEPVPGSVP
jgi:hypothetical protein